MSEQHKLALWKTKQFRDLMLVTMSFFFIFFGFSSAQIIQTTAHRADPTLGPKMLAILYVFYMLSSSIASSIVAKLGIRVSFISSALAYALFIASNILVVPALAYIAGALCGIGAGVLWTAHGAYITNLTLDYEVEQKLPSGSTLGTFNGIFWSIFQVSRVMSNLAVAISFQLHQSELFVFAMLTFSTAIGNCLMFFARIPRQQKNAQEVAVSLGQGASTMTEVEVRELKEDQSKEESLAQPVSNASVGENWEFSKQKEEREIHEEPLEINKSPQPGSVAYAVANLRLLAQPRLALVLPVVVYQGVSLAFIFGVLPTLESDASLRFFGMTCFSIGDMISCFVSGRISDRIGRRPVIYFGLLTQALAYIMIFTRKQSESEVISYLILAFLLGMGDGAWNTMPGAIIGDFFKDKPTQAFGNYRLAQAIGVALAWAYYPVLGVTAKQIICVVSLIIGVTSLQILHSCVESIDPKRFSFKKN